MAKPDRAIRFGRGLRAIMMREDIDSTLLGEWIDEPCSKVESWCSGTKYPTESQLEKIEDVFHVCTAEIESLVPVEWLDAHSGDDVGACFAAGLKAKLRSNTMTVNELAQRSGITKDSIDNWLDGRYKPSLVNAAKAAGAIGATIDEVIRIGRAEIRNK